MTEIFWTAFVGSVIGLCVLLIRYILKCKCDTVKCCGIYIHRTISEEVGLSDISPRV